VTRLLVERLGKGEPVVLIHGSIVGGRTTWLRQLPLADRWSLVLVDRPGFGANPSRTGRVDYETDGTLVADLLHALGGAHLVGHSYGGLVALFAAARAAPFVSSLTVIEPPAFALLRDNPVVEAYVACFQELWRNPPRESEEFLRRFLALVGVVELPEPLPDELVRGAELLRDERHVWDAQIPVETLRLAPYAKLVVSGDHEPAFELLCDRLEVELRAERATVAGASHSIPRAGEPFNQLLETFLRSSSSRYRAASRR
jgi:pimeloyl-ACP methyl ester carboxylesterase